MITKYKYLALLLPLLLQGIIIRGQQVERYLEIRGMAEMDEKPMGNATATLFDGSTRVKSVQTGADGTFSFRLEANKNYTVEVSKSGLVTKRISFNTTLPDEETGKWVSEFGMVMVRPCEGVDYSLLDKPVDIVKFNARRRSFESDKDYNEQMMPKLQEINIKSANCLQDKYNQLIDKAETLFEQKNYEAAQAAYQQAAEIMPGEPYPQKKISEIEALMEKQKKDEEMSRQQAEQQSQQQARQQSVDNEYKAAVDQADALFKAKKYEEAREAYAKALTIKPSESYPRAKSQEIEKAIQQQSQNEHVAKKEELSKSLDSYLDEGDTQYKAKNYDAARAAYANVLKIDPSDSYAKQQIARIEKMMVNEQAAQQKSVEDGYKDAIDRANTAMAQKQFGLARDQYQKALSYKPDDAFAKTRIDEAGKLEKEQIKNQAAAEQQNKQYQDAVASADRLFQAKDFQGALSGYNQALKIKPDDAYAQQRIKGIENAMAAEQAAKEKSLAEEKAAKEKALAEQAAKEKALAEEKVAREKALAAEQAAKEKSLAEEKAAKEKALAEQAAKEKALAEEKAAKEKALAAEQAAKEKSLAEEKAAKEKALAEQAAKEKALAEEKAARDKALAEQAAKEKALAEEKAARDKALAEQAAKEKALAEEKAAREKALAEQAAKEKALAEEKAAREKALAEQAAKEKALAEEKAAKEKALAEQAAKEKALAAEQAAKERALAEQAAKEKALAEEKAAKEKALAEQAAKEKALAEEKAAREKALAEQAAKEKTLADAKAKEDAYNSAVLSGNGAYGQRKYFEAKGFYSQALKIKPEDVYAKDQILLIDNLMADLDKQKKAEEARQKQYNDFIALADKAFDAANYPSAKENYQKALAVIPDSPYPKQKIARIDEINKLLAQQRAATDQSSKKAATATPLKQLDFKNDAERDVYLNDLKRKYPEGVTVEIYKEQYQEIKRYIIVRDDIANEFRDVLILSYRGHEYTKNGKTVTQMYFDQQVKNRPGEYYNETIFE